jgi:hypothetical protein
LSESILFQQLGEDCRNWKQNADVGDCWGKGRRGDIGRGRGCPRGPERETERETSLFVGRDISRALSSIPLTPLSRKGSGTHSIHKTSHQPPCPHPTTAMTSDITARANCQKNPTPSYLLCQTGSFMKMPTLPHTELRVRKGVS